VTASAGSDGGRKSKPLVSYKRRFGRGHVINKKKSIQSSKGKVTGTTERKEWGHGAYPAKKTLIPGYQMGVFLEQNVLLGMVKKGKKGLSRGEKRKSREHRTVGKQRKSSL